VNLHLTKPEGCILAETDLGDGITSDIVEKLKSRKKSDQYQTESERWGEIYMLLFPNQLIPDPCKIELTLQILLLRTELTQAR
jgi:hypothetical protein